MKKISVLLSVILLVTSALSLSACSGGGGESGDKDEGNMDLVRDAFVYTFPLMMMDSTMTNFINTEEPKEGHAPANQLLHSTKLVDASFTDVVSPNRDTVYTQCFLDLSDGPIVFLKPKTDRFCSVEIMDFFTNAISILGSGGSGEEEEICVIAGPNYTDKLPANVTQVRCPTEKACLLVRTVAYDDEDMKNVKEIQSKMKMMPLSNYLFEEEYTPQKGTYNEANDYVPIEHVMSLGPEEYFERANELLTSNPPTTEDRELLEKLFEIGVGPNEKFKVSALGENGEAAYKEMLVGLEDYLAKKSSPFMKKIGQWTFTGVPIAEFGTEYEYRALIAMVGLLANPVNVAVYPSAETDSEGNALDGKNEYTIHFEKDELPPVEKNGFWSITAYNEKRGFIDNELDRYLINDRSDYKLNDDGSLTLYLQSNKPKDKEKVNNWLPVGDKKFSLMMRIYLPQENVTEGKWNGPEIKKVNEAT